jgi:uncharacterized protein (TIGR02594 family)
MSNSKLIYEHARKDAGLKELPGPKSAPRIKRAIQLAADWLEEDDSVTAWCGCIRGLWGFETSTGVPSAHYRARNWLEWGVAVPLGAAVAGDTVVLKRAGGFHVALFDRLAGDFVWLFGGNQSDAVNVSRYRRGDVVGVRRGL